VRSGGLQLRHWEKQRRLDKILLPALRHYPIGEIDVADHVMPLIDRLAAAGKRRTADMVVTDLTTIEEWYAPRNKGYVKRFKGNIPKMDKAKPRKRVLSENELRAVWDAAGQSGAFGAIIKMLLFTAQRREKVTTMKWNDLNLETGRWTIPRPDKGDPKGSPEWLMLPAPAIAVLKEQLPKRGDYVFPSARGRGPVIGLGQLRRAFDAKLPPMPRWVLHDLRRTSRTTMMRIKIEATVNGQKEEIRAIDSELAEAIIGHQIGGVEGIYAQYKFESEMPLALARLADKILSIVGENVVPLAAPARAAG
jgi:integrase